MFDIGKVLFVISRKGNKIFPVQVTECVIRKTLRGETCEHTVIIPNKDRAKMKLEEMDVDVFVTPQEALDHMRSNALAAITSMVEIAVEVAASVFGVSENVDTPRPEEIPDQDTRDYDESSPLVDLGNGMKARVKFNTEIQ